MEGQSRLLSSQRLKTPEMGTKQDWTSPSGTGVLEAVSMLGRPDPGLSRVPALQSLDLMGLSIGSSTNRCLMR